MMEVGLSTDERRETCIATLRMCARIARDLCDDARDVDGPVALQALAAVFDEIVESVE